MILSACSTVPSIQLIDPLSKVKKIKVAPPKSTLTECPKLKRFESDDTREAIKTLVANNELYSHCANKMKSAVKYIKSVNADR